LQTTLTFGLASFASFVPFLRQKPLTLALANRNFPIL
jgi:hypothetical protein